MEPGGVAGAPRAARFAAFILVLSSALVVATLMVLTAAELALAGSRAAFARTNGITVYSEVERLFPVETLDVLRGLPGVRALAAWPAPGAVARPAYPEPPMERPGGQTLSLYRPFLVELEGTRRLIIATSNAFPFVLPGWIDPSPGAEGRWLSTRDGVLVSQTELESRGWKLDDVLRLAAPRGSPFESVDARIVGTYRGWLPGFFVMHFGYLDEHLNDGSRGKTPGGGIMCEPGRCQELIDAFYQRTAGRALRAVYTPTMMLANIESCREAQKLLRVASAFALSMAFLGAVLVAPRVRPRLITRVATGAAFGVAAVLAATRGSLAFSPWVFERVPITGLSVAAGLGGALAVGAASWLVRAKGRDASER